MTKIKEKKNPIFSSISAGVFIIAIVYYLLTYDFIVPALLGAISFVFSILSLKGKETPKWLSVVTLILSSLVVLFTVGTFLVMMLIFGLATQW